MIRKKKIIIFILFLACITLMISSVNTYKSYKSYYNLRTAIIDIILEENKTVAWDFEIKDNGISIAKFNNILKRESKKISSYGNKFSFASNEYYENKYNDGGKTILVTREIINGEESSHREEGENSNENYEAKSGFLRIAIDTIAGSMKNYFVEEGNKITLKLKENQHMAFINFLSMHMGNGENNKFHVEDDLKSYKKNIMPLFLEEYKGILTTEVKPENTKIAIELDGEKRIKKIDIDMDISGKDKDKDTHRISIEGTINVSNLNNTVADKINN